MNAFEQWIDSGWTNCCAICFVRNQHDKEEGWEEILQPRYLNGFVGPLEDDRPFTPEELKYFFASFKSKLASIQNENQNH